MADQIGTIHHEFHFTVEEALDAIPDVVYHLESFEQVRASAPMFLLSRKIKAMGIKMVLSGEGADETLGGYLYFHKVRPQLCVKLHPWKGPLHSPVSPRSHPAARGVTCAPVSAMPGSDGRTAQRSNSFP